MEELKELKKGDRVVVVPFSFCIAGTVCHEDGFEGEVYSDEIQDGKRVVTIENDGYRFIERKYVRRLVDAQREKEERKNKKKLSRKKNAPKQGKMVISCIDCKAQREIKRSYEGKIKRCKPCQAEYNRKRARERQKLLREKKKKS